MKTSTRLAVALFLFSITAAVAPVAECSEYALQPALTLSEEYNDNIFLTPQNPVTDYITRIIPSIRLVYKAPLWDWNVAYAYDYRIYARRTVTNDTTHTLDLLNHTTILKEFFFIDVRDDYYRVSTDIIHDFTQQSLSVNQSDTNVLSVKPYLTVNLSSHMTATTGYEYRNVWYKDPNAIDKTDNSVYANVNDELSLRTIMTAGVKYTQTKTKTFDFYKTDLFIGPRYEYADGSTLWFIIGNSWFSFGQTGSSSQAFWDIGFAHKFRTYTLSFNTALTYVDDPLHVLRREDRYVGTFNKKTDRFTLGLTAGLWEYRDVATKHLQDSRYSTGGTISYNITPALKGTYSLTVDRYENNQDNTFSMLYLNGVGFDYLVAEKTTLALGYQNTHGYSPDAVNFNQNYDNNRITLELRKQF